MKIKQFKLNGLDYYSVNYTGTCVIISCEKPEKLSRELNNFRKIISLRLKLNVDYLNKCVKNN